MYKEEKIIDLIITMIEQSNKRMEEINQKDKNGYCALGSSELSAIRLAQKEFEMQIKLLERVVKDFKGGKGIIDVTPERLQIKKG